MYIHLTHSAYTTPYKLCLLCMQLNSTYHSATSKQPNLRHRIETSKNVSHRRLHCIHVRPAPCSTSCTSVHTACPRRRHSPHSYLKHLYRMAPPFITAQAHLSPTHSCFAFPATSFAKKASPISIMPKNTVVSHPSRILLSPSNVVYFFRSTDPLTHVG
jgi:hypothetical protein